MNICFNVIQFFYCGIKKPIFWAVCLALLMDGRLLFNVKISQLHIGT